MAERIAAIDTRGIKGKVILAATLLAALIFAYFSISWQVGNMLAALTASNEPNARSIADFAYWVSPRDPITNWLKANVERESFTAQNLDQAAKSLEETVRLAPADYRYWLELGRVYEQTEAYDKAEKAFRRAAEIAPNYSNVHWHFGNFLLRRQRETEAFEELRRAAESSLLYREQVFFVVWEYYEKDTAKLEQLVATQPDVRAGLAKFYAARERAEDSLRIWNTLSDEDKQRNIAIARLVAQALHEKRFYRSSVSFVKQTGIEPEAAAETVQNGSFETPLAIDGTGIFFGWQLSKREKMDVSTDLIKRQEGGKSLRITLNNYAGVELKNLLQIVAVEPARRYRLTYWLKTENLKSAGTPTLEIVNANDEKIITSGIAFPAGTQDWTQIKVEFSTPSNAQAIALRLDRAYCGDACAISGVFWLDDFKLERLD